MLDLKIIETTSGTLAAAGVLNNEYKNCKSFYSILFLLQKFFYF